jgi:hypothetical protein
LTDGLSEIGQRVGVGLDVVPLVRFGASTDGDDVGVGAQFVRAWAPSRSMYTTEVSCKLSKTG